MLRIRKHRTSGSMHYRFTIVAVAIAATCAPLAFAEQSPSYVQCLALVKQQKITEAEPICAQAAAEPGKSGKLLFADFLTHKEDWHCAIARCPGSWRKTWTPSWMRVRCWHARRRTSNSCQ